MESVTTPRVSESDEWPKSDLKAAQAPLDSPSIAHHMRARHGSHDGTTSDKQCRMPCQKMTGREQRCLRKMPDNHCRMPCQTTDRKSQWPIPHGENRPQEHANLFWSKPNERLLLELGHLCAVDMLNGVRKPPPATGHGRGRDPSQGSRRRAITSWRQGSARGQGSQIRGTYTGSVCFFGREGGQTPFSSGKKDGGEGARHWTTWLETTTPTEDGSIQWIPCRLRVSTPRQVQFLIVAVGKWAQI